MPKPKNNIQELPKTKTVEQVRKDLMRGSKAKMVEADYEDLELRVIADRANKEKQA